MARSFNGSSGQLNYASAAGQIGLTQISVHAKIYRSGGGEGGYGDIFRQFTSGNDKWHFNNDNGDAGWGLRWVAQFTGAPGAWSVPYPANSAWHDYVITYDGASTANVPVIYKDGASITVTNRLTPSGTLKTLDAATVIGNNGTDASTWNGRLCEIAFWNRILTAAEAALLGAGYSPLFIPRGLVFYAPLRGSGPEADLVGGVVPTITATGAIDHPRIIYPTRPHIIHVPPVVVPPSPSGFRIFGDEALVA